MQKRSVAKFGFATCCMFLLLATAELRHSRAGADLGKLQFQRTSRNSKAAEPLRLGRLSLQIADTQVAESVADLKQSEDSTGLPGAEDVDGQGLNGDYGEPELSEKEFEELLEEEEDGDTTTEFPDVTLPSASDALLTDENAADIDALDEDVPLVDRSAGSHSPPNEMKKDSEIPVLPKDDAIERALDAHKVDPLPQPKNTTTKKVTELTEKNADATQEEEETLETLEDLQKPVGKESLDSALALENALEEERLGEEAGKLDDPMKGKIQKEKDTIASDSNDSLIKQNLPGKDNLEEELEDTLRQEEEEGEPVSTLGALPGGSTVKNSSLVTQGVIIGSTIKDMVSEKSSSIAGVVALIVAVAAGFAVACAGISIYKRFRNRRGGKHMPRIIEIGSLPQPHKSPSYSRVAEKYQDAEGSSGARWQDWDEKWEENSPSPLPHSRSAAAKQKKAWEWDAEW